MVSAETRPKSANLSYDKMVRGASEELPDEDTPGLGPRRSSSVLWACSSTGLTHDQISRPSTSNPALATHQHVKAEPCSSAYLPEDFGYTGESEVLWADIGPTDVKVARPMTSNPRMDACKADSCDSGITPEHAPSGVLWSSEGSVLPSLVERPHTTNTQLEPNYYGSPANAPQTSAVLWASEGSVGSALVERPKAWNRQMDELGGGETVQEERGDNVSAVLWSAGEAESQEQDMFVESCTNSIRSDVRPSSAPLLHKENRAQVQRPATAAARVGAGVTLDAHYWGMFKELSPTDNTIAKSTFLEFYSSLEHFGAPHNAAKMCAKYTSHGMDRLSFEEFCIIMLKWSSR